MTYACGSIVYGVNLKTHYGKFHTFTEDQLDEICRANEEKADGFKSEYSGNGEGPFYFGFKLSGIDEGSDIKITNLRATPSEQQIIKYQEKLEEIREEFPALYSLLEEPYVFITWGSS